jgi:hypothetical protein
METGIKAVQFAGYEQLKKDLIGFGVDLG